MMLFVVAEWLVLLIRFRGIPRSNVAPENGCPNRGSPWFYSVPRYECRDSALN
jgi:hypothetical protein